MMAHVQWLLIPSSLVAARMTFVLTKPTRDQARELNYVYCLMDLDPNARAPVAHLVTTSDQNSEDPGLNPGCISVSRIMLVPICMYIII